MVEGIGGNRYDSKYKKRYVHPKRRLSNRIEKRFKNALNPRGNERTGSLASLFTRWRAE